MCTTYFILEQKNPPKKLKPMHLHIAQWLIPVPLDPSRKKWLKTDSYVVFQTVDHARSCCKKQSLYWKNAWTIADEAANRQLKEIDLQPMQKQSTEWLQKGKGNENVQKLWQKIKHEWGMEKWPAYDKTWTKCFKQNHFHSVCLQTRWEASCSWKLTIKWQLL